MKTRINWEKTKKYWPYFLLEIVVGWVIGPPYILLVCGVIGLCLVYTFYWYDRTYLPSKQELLELSKVEESYIPHTPIAFHSYHSPHSTAPWCRNCGKPIWMWEYDEPCVINDHCTVYKESAAETFFKGKKV